MVCLTHYNFHAKLCFALHIITFMPNYGLHYTLNFHAKLWFALHIITFMPSYGLPYTL